MDLTGSLPPILRLPTVLRQKIYTYLLLAPHPDEQVTTINYDLKWPYLDHPSSTTFTAHQLDHCKCPQESTSAGDPTSPEHIYTRYVCRGPEVRFSTRSQPLWILQESGPAFNILRPASAEELEQRPDAGIVRVNKLIYKETLPLLYRGRNFLILTGICSRGRYQAYATQDWLLRMSPSAQSQITSLSLLCQSKEEDCQDPDALKAYMLLSQFMIQKLPRCRSLCLNVWSSEIPIYPFGLLFRRKDMRIFLMRHNSDEDMHVISNASMFLRHCGGGRYAEEWLKLTSTHDYEEDDTEDEEWELVRHESLNSA